MLVAELMSLLQTSAHTTFQRLLQQTLLPCLQTILAFTNSCITAHESAQTTAPSKASEGSEQCEELRHRGKAWTMLGLLRLHLAAPPAGADPVGKYALKKAHLERMLSEDVLPETQVSFTTS